MMKIKASFRCRRNPDPSTLGEGRPFYGTIDLFNSKLKMDEKNSRPGPKKHDTSDEPDAEIRKVKAFPENDLVLVVENEELHVNSQILKNVSPVFRAMLQSDFREKKEKRIVLKDKKYDDVVKFLKCIYPFIQDKITVENVFQLIPIADEYQLDLKCQCEEFLTDMLYENTSSAYSKPENENIKQFDEPGYGKCGFDMSYEKRVSADIVVKSILAAEKYGMERLLVETIKYAAIRKFETLEHLPEYMEISVETRYKILALKIRIIEESSKDKSSMITKSKVDQVIYRGYE